MTTGCSSVCNDHGVQQRIRSCELPRWFAPDRPFSTAHVSHISCMHSNANAPVPRILPPQQSPEREGRLRGEL
eukprot:CAMPEP_0174730932 /NCGR_PEP_ID=MMETSP1094-20130205/56536_1 /TAXON_ID=156173 /ORGANISM="Chrysochromulina brevifilum, Strain UTEX LB 985" /LENGTH=72 /DNA_ID=CAMNT_0015933255 /DNA_START=157 /DNA_END=375 /DNA_ORIENTATION=+